MCSKYKLKLISKDSNDLSVGFDGSKQRREEELTKNGDVPNKCRLHIRLSKAVLGNDKHLKMVFTV